MASAAPTHNLVPEPLGAWARLRRDRAAIVSALLLMLLVAGCLLVPWLSSWRYDQTDLALGATPPSLEHWMGTDEYGRDLMARAFFGGRISLAVGLLATVLSLLIGVAWGGVAGYVGRWVDAVMMRLVDVLYAFPFLVFVILVSVFFAGRDGAPHRAFVALLGWFTPDAADPRYFPHFQVLFVLSALGAVSWLTMARIVRGQVLSLKAEPFVEAARCMGVGPLGIIARHLIPNAAGPIVAYATLTVPHIMLTEAFLSFLGLGTQEPLASWGVLVASGADAMGVHPWLLVFPGALLVVTLVCLNFVGDGLRHALDPRGSKGKGR